MILTTKAQILDGSRVYRLWRLAARESLAKAVTLEVTRILRNIFLGSRALAFLRRRIAPLFLVGDYLERHTDYQTALLDSSLVWKRLKNKLEGISETFSRRGIRPVIEGSAVGKFLLLPAGAADRVNPRRRAMALFATFALCYYTLRTLLLLFIPGANYYSGWAGGLILGLLLSSVYLYLMQRTDSDV